MCIAVGLHMSQAAIDDASGADAAEATAAAAAPAAMIEDKEKMAEYESKMKKLFPKLKVSHISLLFESQHIASATVIYLLCTIAQV